MSVRLYYSRSVSHDCSTQRRTRFSWLSEPRHLIYRCPKRHQRKQMSKVTRQKAASPSCRPSQRQIHSSDACAKQAHSPAAAGKQCAMYSCVGTLRLADTCLLKSDSSCAWGIWTPSNTLILGPTLVSPKRHFDRVSGFCTAHSCAHTHICTLRATSVATGRIGAGEAARKLTNRIQLTERKNK